MLLGYQIRGCALIRACALIRMNTVCLFGELTFIYTFVCLFGELTFIYTFVDNATCAEYNGGCKQICIEGDFEKNTCGCFSGFDTDPADSKGCTSKYTHIYLCEQKLFLDIFLWCGLAPQTIIILTRSTSV